MQYSRVRRHPGGHQRPVSLPHTHAVVLKVGDHRILAKLCAVSLHYGPGQQGSVHIDDGRVVPQGEPTNDDGIEANALR